MLPLRGIVRPLKGPTRSRWGWRFSTLVVVILIPLLFADAASGAQESGEARLRIAVGALLAAGFLLRAHYVRDTFVSGSRPNPAEDDIARAFLALALGTSGTHPAEGFTVFVASALFVRRQAVTITTMFSDVGAAGGEAVKPTRFGAPLILLATPDVPRPVAATSEPDSRAPSASRFVGPNAAVSARVGALLPQAFLALAPLVALALLYTPARASWAIEGALASVLFASLATVAWHLADARAERRFELGASARLGWSLTYLALFASAPLLFSLLRIAPLRAGWAFAALVSTLVTGPLLSSADPRTPVAMARRAFVVAGTALPIALVGATFGSGNALGTSGERWRMVVVLITALVCLLVGLLSPHLEEPFLAASGVLLKSLREAREALEFATDGEVVTRVLFALRDRVRPAISPMESASWISSEPPGRIVVDRAGYARTVGSHVSQELLEVAAAEPFGILRVEVLEVLEGKRPALRPMLARFREEDLFCVVAAARGGIVRGGLVLPRGTRFAYLELEEAIVLRELVDATSESVARREDRELAASREQARVRECEELAERCAFLEHRALADAHRHLLATQRLARADFVPAPVGDALDALPSRRVAGGSPGFYGTASREAVERLSRRFAAFASSWVVVPASVDPLPYFARAHLATPRADRPFVVVDASEPREHDLSRWQSRLSSPLAAAADGVLVILDALALPKEIQDLVGEALALRRAPWDEAVPLETTLAVATVLPPTEQDEQAFAGRLATAAKNPIELPTLASRPEDLHFLVSEALARQSLRVRGRVMGIEDRAYAVLAEYDFPDDEVELAALVARLVRECEGEVVRYADVVRALG